MGAVTSLILLSLVVVGILSFVQGNWQSGILAFATIAIVVVPFIIEWRVGIYVPAIFSLIISAFLYATLILGQVDNYYGKFWWWDVMLHSGSGLAFGLIGLLVLLIALKKGRIDAKPIVLCLFSFCFALAVGLLWEVFEFTGDEIFHTNMQHRETGVTDTMKDEIMDTIGALIGASLGYVYLQPGLTTPLDAIITKTIRRNRRKKSE